MRFAQINDIPKIEKFLDKQDEHLPSGDRIVLSENEGVINGLAVLIASNETNYNIVTFCGLFGLTNSIKRDIIEWVKTNYTSYGQMFSKRPIIFFGYQDVFLECDFKEDNGIMVYRQEIPCTIKLYQDAGQYTKTHPLVKRESVQATSEHEARRYLFEKYTKDYNILSIDIDHEKEMAEL